MTRPVALIVLDGWGLAPAGPGNAVDLADTPNFDRFWETAPHTELQASGRAVGLPEGQIGNSEVGHMNLGAGRVVLQSLTYLQDQIETGAFFENDILNDTLDAAGEGAVHIMGLVSRGGVHSELEHIVALLELTVRRGAQPVYVHAFTDGRDTPPQSGKGYVTELQAAIDELDHDVKIATVGGRYFAMDRDRRWDRTQRAYDAVVCGDAEYQAPNAIAAIEAAYERGETDEFIAPTVMVDDDGPVGEIRDGDAVIFFNFRADRARQLTYALVRGTEFTSFERCRHPQVHYTSLMQYDAELDAPYAFTPPGVDVSLAEVLERQGLTQHHTAETEKYAHVTYFFNAKREDPHEGETRTMVPSPKIATYDLQPEMSAAVLTEKAVERLRDHDDDFMLLNYANPDMVGHTGDLAAAITACEAVDEGLGQLVDAILDKGGAAIILADHGNAEVMIDETGGPHTAHTTNPVPCIILGAEGVRLRQGGVLGDVAPTVLQLLGVDVPPEMTGTSLLLE